ncbi:hypothetical protein MLD38_002056 [Melastoma candidum]|uniref:Uncharacterized protein n=1 Tax=Melastoma candidum TaxID=119954 RepID=A0ACB9SK52_9MYRT|nr:hypothetical protein MLD38_002056 [Melastoma candidum]
MDSGLPVLNCLLQHTLRSLCSSDSDSSSSSSSSSTHKWVYAVFWRILPRNYPPPKWEFGGGAVDRAKGNKRNWILVWEDGFCDVYECERGASGFNKGGFGPEVFFKMAHEVYNYGEGVVGKVAADNGHKWVFRETSTDNDLNCISSWNAASEPQPKAWEFQFNSGIETIAVISVREGIVQLGSLNKIPEDTNLVISIQRKFGYLHSIPGIFPVQRPYLSLQGHSYIEDEKLLSMGTKRLLEQAHECTPIKSLNLGWNSPRDGAPEFPFWSGLSPCNLGSVLSKIPSPTSPPYYHPAEALNALLDVKLEPSNNRDGEDNCHRS